MTDGYFCTDAVFNLNGEKVHKSEVVKKTLSPTWNESFAVDVPSRVAAVGACWIDIYDWDRVGKLYDISHPSWTAC